MSAKLVHKPPDIYDTRARRTARRLLIVAAIIGVVVSMSYWLRLSFWFELPSNYSPQLAIAMVAIFLMFAASALYEGINQGWHRVMTASPKSWVSLVVATATLIHIVTVPLLMPTRAVKAEQTAGSSLRVMTFNKLYDNREYPQIINYVASRQPDILAIQEIFYDEAELLAASLGYEQWHMAECDCSAYGSDLALFSRFPLDNVDMAFEDRLGGVLRGEVELSIDRTLTVYVAHIVVPYSSLAYSIRQDMLDQLAAEINAETNPVILMGDFNSSPYSFDIRKLGGDLTGLNLAADKPWARCTWFGYGELLCASIDHIFVPDSVVITDKEVGPASGSDHRPVDVEIVFD